ncbi:autotransporter assembly complex protein TamA [Frateuria aurantia]
MLRFAAAALTALLPLDGMAGVLLKVEGLPDTLQQAVVSASGLTAYAKRPVSEAQAQRLFKQLQAQVDGILRPYGYYHSTAHGKLTAQGQDWALTLTVDAGPPVVIQQVGATLTGAAARLPAVRTALKGLRAMQGQQLNDGSYESARDAVSTALKANGYLDATLEKHRVEVDPGHNQAVISLSWKTGPRYQFGTVQFSGSQFRPGILDRYVPFKPGAAYTQDQLLQLQQALTTTEYFSMVDVEPDLAHRQNLRIPIMVHLRPGKQTLYTGGPFYGTDTGPGIRAGLGKRWINRRGHKWSNELILAQRLKSLSTLYTIPMPGPNQRSFNFGANFLDANTVTSVAHTFELVANETRMWHGWTRTLAVHALTGTFTVGKRGTESDRASGLEHGSSTLVYAEASLARKRMDNSTFVRHGWSLTFTARSTAGDALSSARFSQLMADAKWIYAFAGRNRLILRGTAAATDTNDFDALPPQLRFFAGGDRSVRGYAYQAIGPLNASGRVIGGRNLLIASTEMEHYFTPHWGMAGFVDAGNAFNGLDYRPQLGTGLGVRWLSPVGMIRVDIGTPIHSIYGHGVELHVNIGPDL